MKLQPITKSDLVEAKNGVEHITAHEFFNPKLPAKVGIFHFGKYKGRTYESVRESDPGYYQWCEENIRGFK